MLFVHREGCKTFLPPVAPPVFAEIDPEGIAALALANGTRQARFILRYIDQVHVVWHQAPGPDSNLMLTVPKGYQFDIGLDNPLRRKMPAGDDFIFE